MRPHRTLVIPVIVVAAGLAVLGSVGRADAGQLRPAIGLWTPTECVKPTAPVASSANATALNVSIDSYNGYVRIVNAYNECVRQAAERDMQIIRLRSLEAQEHVLNEANAARPSRMSNRAPY